MGNVPWYLSSTFYQKWPLPPAWTLVPIRGPFRTLWTSGTHHRGGGGEAMKRLNKNLELETLQNRFCNHEKSQDGNTWKPMFKGLIWKMTFLFKVLIFRLSMLVVFVFSAERREGKMGSPWWEDVLNLKFWLLESSGPQKTRTHS